MSRSPRLRIGLLLLALPVGAVHREAVIRLGALGRTPKAG
jgi:hypothetical protein